LAESFIEALELILVNSTQEPPKSIIRRRSNSLSCRGVAVKRKILSFLDELLDFLFEFFDVFETIVNNV